MQNSDELDKGSEDTHTVFLPCGPCNADENLFYCEISYRRLDTHN